MYHTISQAEGQPGSEPGFIISAIKASKARRAFGEASREALALLPTPLFSVEVYAVDTKIRRRVLNRRSPSGSGSARGVIKSLSAKSANRLKFNARNVTTARSLITLTYPKEFPTDGRVCRDHFKRFRQALQRRGLSGLWFREFQRRGAPHYHIFIDGTIRKGLVAKLWYQIVGSGDEKHLRAGTRVEAIKRPHAMAAYAAKYAAKSEQKDVPEGFESVGRFWGVFGDMRPKPERITEGGIEAVAPLIRAAKKVEAVDRAARGARPRRDNGVQGFTMWGQSPKVGPVLQRLC
jgi:hypothetical protein